MLFSFEIAQLFLESVSLVSLTSVWSSMSKITKIFSLFLCLHSMDTGIELCQSNFDMISRLKRDTPSVIQRNSWPMFFQSCSISQLVFAYPLVKQNGRLMLFVSSWLQNYLSIHHQVMKGKITKPHVHRPQFLRRFDVLNITEKPEVA